MTRDRIYPRPKRPGNRMTWDRNNTASPSIILPPPIPYPILPNHLPSSHLTPTSNCIIPYLLPFPIPTPYTSTPTTPKTSHFVASWYRPPDDKTEELELFKNQLEKVKTLHKGNKPPLGPCLG